MLRQLAHHGSSFVVALLFIGVAGCSDSNSPAPPPPNMAPVIASASAVSVDEGAGVAYAAAAFDPEGAALSYAIAGGADAALFAIDGATGVVTFLAPPDFANPADADADNVYQIQISISDGAAASEIGVSIEVLNVITERFLETGVLEIFGFIGGADFLDDLDGDGAPELVLGHTLDAGFFIVDSAEYLSLADPALALNALTPSTIKQFTSENSSAQFLGGENEAIGVVVRAADDIDGDGDSDIIVSAGFAGTRWRGFPSVASGAGAMFIAPSSTIDFTATGATILDDLIENDTGLVADNTGLAIDGSPIESQFALDLALLPDISGDGAADVLVGEGNTEFAYLLFSDSFAAATESRFVAERGDVSGATTDLAPTLEFRGADPFATQIGADVAALIAPAPETRAYAAISTRSGFWLFDAANLAGLTNVDVVNDVNPDTIPRTTARIVNGATSLEDMNYLSDLDADGFADIVASSLTDPADGLVGRVAILSGAAVAGPDPNPLVVESAGAPNAGTLINIDYVDPSPSGSTFKSFSDIASIGDLDGDGRRELALVDIDFSSTESPNGFLVVVPSGLIADAIARGDDTLRIDELTPGVARINAPPDTDAANSFSSDPEDLRISEVFASRDVDGDGLEDIVAGGASAAVKALVAGERIASLFSAPPARVSVDDLARE